MEIMRERNEGRQGGNGSQEEIMQGDKRRETRRQRQPRAGQYGDHAGRQMREARRQGQSRAGQNGDHAGRQMKEGKVAGAAKSSPEWRSCRETDEGRQGGSRPEWRSRRETNEGRQGGSKAAVALQPSGDWGSATQSLRSKNPFSFQLFGKNRRRPTYVFTFML